MTSRDAIPGVRYWAVVPAAGQGSRMGGIRPKQYLALAGRCVLEWSLAPLLSTPWIDAVVVVIAEADAHFRSLPIAGHPRLVVTSTPAGERADSVLAGLHCVARRCLAPERVRVLVHDAARPCLRRVDIERLRDGDTDAHGALLAMPTVDTLKREDATRAVATVDRQRLWRAQTPQLFALPRLIAALQQARTDGATITDEASAMEHAGHRPRLVRGSERNLKITWPDDLPLAEFWLGRPETPA